MSLLDSIKSLLGLEREERVPSEETRVTVERERGGAEPATAAENAVKGADADGVDTDPEPTPTPDDSEMTADVERASGAETDAAASTGSMVDEDAGIEPAEAVAEADTDTGPAVEPAEAAGPVAGEPDADPESEPEPDSAELEDATDELNEAAGGEPTDAIKGIGNAYAERLTAAGIETVSDLANADPEALSEETSVSQTRIERWIDRARQRLE